MRSTEEGVVGSTMARQDRKERRERDTIEVEERARLFPHFLVSNDFASSSPTEFSGTKLPLSLCSCCKREKRAASFFGVVVVLFQLSLP